MKKIIAFIILACIVFYFSFLYINNYFLNEKKTEDILSVNLYYANNDFSNFEVETRHIKNTEGTALIKKVLSELIKGPSQPNVKSTIPSQTQIIDVEQEGTVVNVNLSEEYSNTNNTAEDIIARFSIVRTLCDLQNINKVKIFVDGKELLDNNGSPLGVLGKDDIVFEATPHESKTEIVLYFVGSEGEFLVPEKRELDIKEGETERVIINEIIKGPKDQTHYPSIPAETKLLDIETKEGTCFINLSPEIITKHWGGSSGELFTIYSIVNSLTELDKINRVQFLIDGKKTESFIHMVFNEPFERDESLIKDIG